jgi:hypothetical protein
MCKLAASQKKDGQRRRELKGCWNEQSMPVYIHDRKIKYTKCPANYFDSYVSSLVDLVSSSPKITINESFKMPAKLVDMINLVDNLISIERDKHVKRSQRNHHSGRKKGS